MKITQRHVKSGFTLIELMAVITIIVILAGLVVGGMGFVSQRQAAEKAKVQIALLSKALEEYKLDMGTYPPTNNTPSGLATTKDLYLALFYEGYDYAAKNAPTTWVKTVGSNNAFPKATKIYLPDLDPTTSKQGWVTTTTSVPATIASILDPWGNEYGYRTATSATGAVNASTLNPDFDLWSYGKDGKTRTAALTHADNDDDIKNF